MPSTTNFNLNLPDVGADFDGWGGEINVTLGEIDGLIFANKEAIAALPPSEDPTFTGVITGDLEGDVTGDLTGNVTGDVTGNVTGDVTGNVTGNVSGTAGSLANPVDVSITGDITAEATGFVGTGNIVLDASLSAALTTTINGKQNKPTISASAPSGGVDGDIWLQI